MQPSVSLLPFGDERTLRDYKTVPSLPTLSDRGVSVGALSNAVLVNCLLSSHTLQLQKMQRLPLSAKVLSRDPNDMMETLQPKDLLSKCLSLLFALTFYWFIYPSNS